MALTRAVAVKVVSEGEPGWIAGYKKKERWLKSCFRQVVLIKEKKKSHVASFIKETK